MNWLRITWITGLAVVLLGVAHRVYGDDTPDSSPDITQYIKDHYRYGTLFQHNKSYMDVYRSSTNRNLSLTNLKVSEERISGFYKVTLKDKSGGYKTETGVMVFHIKDGIPIREEHVLVKEEILSKYTHDLALSGQMADVVTTAAALAAGGIEANPIVSGLIGSPIGAVAWVGMKVALVYAPEYLSLKECIEAKKGVGSAGWALAGLNIGAFVHPIVGLMAAAVAGVASYEELEKTAAIACVT
jgi:hypothetical protein